MRIAVLTLSGSLYGLKLLNGLARAGRPADVVVVVHYGFARRLRLLRRVAASIGWRDALLLAAERVADERRSARVVDWRGGPLVRDYEALAGQVVRASTLRDPAAHAALADPPVDLALLGQSGIVPESMLGLPTLGTLNAHPGWLPGYRGLDSFRWAALDERFDRIGATLHLVDAGIDTGAIVEWSPHEWAGDETAASLEEQLAERSIDLLLRGVALADGGTLTGRPQEGEGSYFGIVPRRLRTVADTRLRSFRAR